MRSGDPSDPVRRKLARTSMIVGGGFVLGQIPYAAPAVKSFFGTRSAWAQTSAPACGVVSVVPAPSNVLIGSAAAAGSQTFRVTNTGGVAFNLTAFDTDNPAFSVTSPAPPVPLNPGDFVDVVVELMCTVPGPQTGTLTITTDVPGAPDTCATAALSGDCLLACAVEPNPLSIGPNSLTETFDIRNDGDVPIVVTNLAITNEVPFAQFSFDPIMPPLPRTLNPGDSLTVTMNFFCQTDGTATFAITAETLDGQTVNCPDLALIGTCGLQ